MRQEWRCITCGKLFGMVDGIRLYIQSNNSPSYAADLPATAICNKCGTINELLGKKNEIEGTIKHVVVEK